MNGMRDSQDREDFFVLFDCELSEMRLVDVCECRMSFLFPGTRTGVVQLASDQKHNAMNFFYTYTTSFFLHSVTKDKVCEIAGERACNDLEDGKILRHMYDISFLLPSDVSIPHFPVLSLYPKSLIVPQYL